MSNSSLVVYTKLSPNHSGARTHSIDRITPHCVVGQLSCESICGCFTSTARQASCNYGIGYDGRVSLCVDEGNRSWCSSSNANDQRAVTIEVASGSAEPYEITEKAYDSLVELMADICQRNGKKKLTWFGDKDKTLAYEPAADEMVVTVHRWFENKSCPGTYIYERLGAIVEAVNKKLGSAGTSGTAIMGSAVLGADQLAAFLLSKNSAPKLNGVDAAKLAQLYITEGKTEGVRGDLAFCQSCVETGYWQFTGDVKPEQNNFAGIGATGGGAAGASFADAQTGVRAQIQHLKAYASTDALKNTCVDPRYSLVTKGSATTVEALSGKWATDTGYGAKILAVYAEAAAYKTASAGSTGTTEEKNTDFPAVPFTVQVIVSDLNYRTEPSMSGTVKGQTGKGTFTITQVSNGWGKLKSGAGWIYLENPKYVTIGKTAASGTASTAASVPYTVTVSITDLNIRKGPGTNYAKTGKYTGKGTFTIVEESSGAGSDTGWGKLKSGAGWISLDYCKKN